ncbi:MAG: hypothetical protein RIS75_1088 [Actinomycetota bacterium]|jgi:hypothetical protein
MSVTAQLAFEAAEEHVVNTIPGETWMYGVGAFVLLGALLYVVSRLNPDR